MRMRISRRPIARTGIRRPVLAGLAAATLAGPAWAAEEPVCDGRLFASALPTAFRYTWTDGSSRRQGDDGFRQAVGLGAGLRWGFGPPGSPHRLALGVSGMRTSEELLGGTASAWMAGVSCGWAYAAAPRWQLYAGAAAAAGPAAMDLPGPETGDAHLTGSRQDISAECEVRWRPSPQLGIAAGAGWMAGRDRYRGDGELELQRQGPTATLALVWIIEPRPSRIE